VGKRRRWKEGQGNEEMGKMRREMWELVGIRSKRLVGRVGKTVGERKGEIRKRSKELEDI
jgi:hypothetical protein